MKRKRRKAPSKNEGPVDEDEYCEWVRPAGDRLLDRLREVHPERDPDVDDVVLGTK